MKNPSKKAVESAYERLHLGSYEASDRDIVWMETKKRLCSRARAQRYKTLLDNPDDAVADLLLKVFEQLDSTKRNKTFWQQPTYERFLAYLTTSMKNAGVTSKNRLSRLLMSFTNITRTTQDDTHQSLEFEAPASRGIATRIGDEERTRDTKRILHKMVREGWITADERDICTARQVNKESRGSIAKRFGLKLPRDVSDTWTKIHPLMKKFMAAGLGLDSRGMTR